MKQKVRTSQVSWMTLTQRTRCRRWPRSGGDRIEEVARHDQFSVRTGPNDGLMGRIVRIAVAAHLPASDILLIATCACRGAAERRETDAVMSPMDKVGGGRGYLQTSRDEGLHEPGRVEPGRGRATDLHSRHGGARPSAGRIPDAAPG